MSRASFRLGECGVRGALLIAVLLAALRADPAPAHGSEKHEAAGKTPGASAAAAARRYRAAAAPAPASQEGRAVTP